MALLAVEHVFRCPAQVTLKVAIPILYHYRNVLDHLLQLKEHDTYRTGTPSSLPNTSTGHSVKTSDGLCSCVWLQRDYLYVCARARVCGSVCVWRKGGGGVNEWMLVAMIVPQVQCMVLQYLT